MDHDRGLALTALHSNEGAGVLGHLAKVVQEGADEEELAVRPLPHALVNELMEAKPCWLTLHVDEGALLVQGVRAVLLDDEVVEEGQGVAIFNFATDDVVSCLPLPAKGQLVRLVPRDEDGVAKDVVDRVHEAVVDGMLRRAGRLEPELVAFEDLTRVVHRAIAVLVHVACQVALLLAERADAHVLLLEVDVCADPRAGGTPDTRTLVGVRDCP